MLLPGAVIPWRLNSPISFHKFTSFFTNKKQIRFWEVKMVRKREWKYLWKWICFIYSFGMTSDNILCKLGHTFFKLQFTKGVQSQLEKKKEQFYSTKRNRTDLRERTWSWVSSKRREEERDDKCCLLRVLTALPRTDLAAKSLCIFFDISAAGEDKWPNVKSFFFCIMNLTMFSFFL